MGYKVGWFEVTGKEGAKLRDFYGSMFDWSFTDPGEMDYGMTSDEDSGIGGGIGKSGDGDGHLTFYVEVPDVAESVAKAEKLGGTVVTRPTTIAEFNLTYALVTDPEGHKVGLMKNGG